MRVDNMFNFINKIFTLKSQKIYLISYGIGIPIGYLLVDLISGFSGVTMMDICVRLLFSLFLVSPVLINYIREIRKYKKLLKKIDNKDYNKNGESNDDSYTINTDIYYKAKFNEKDYPPFIKGKSYPIIIKTHHQHSYYEIREISIETESGYDVGIKDIINKFDLVLNLKEERAKKLKKLKRV